MKTELDALNKNKITGIKNARLSNEVNPNLNVENNLDSEVNLKANRFALINVNSHNEGSSALPIAALLLIVLFSSMIITSGSFVYDSMINYAGRFCFSVYSIPSIIYTIILLAVCVLILRVHLAA